MFGRNLGGVDSLDLITAALGIPILSLALAAVALAAVALVRRRRPGPVRQAADSPDRDVTARYDVEQRALGWGAVGVIVVFVAESILRGYVWDLVDVASWWRHAVPLFSASLALLMALALIVGRGTSAPQVPLLPATRRTSAAFGPRRLLPLGAVTLGILVATTVAAGIVSSPDDRGRFIYLEIPLPNTTVDPIRPWFYGWTYGVPVLVSAVLLAAVVALALRTNATRPFLRPDTAEAERIARRRVATGIVRIATAALFLALAGAWRFIGSAVIETMTLADDVSETTYEAALPFAALARWGQGLAPLIEIAAFLLLLLAARSTLPKRRASAHVPLQPVAAA